MNKEIEVKRKRGRPFKATTFPDAKNDEAVAEYKHASAIEGYERVRRMAQDSKLRKSKPHVYADINRWLWEVSEGKPTVKTSSEVKLPVHVTFELVKTPQKQRKPAEIIEAEVKELPVSTDLINYESIGTEETVVADTTGTD